MPHLPVMLKVERRRCVVVGGGAVALRRARALVEAGARVEVFAPRIEADLAAMQVLCHRRCCEAADLEGAALVVIATDDPAVNDRLSAAARAAGALVNRADAAGEGDLTVAAHRRFGPLTLAVDTGGASAAAAAAIRDELAGHLDAAWPVVLEHLRRYRQAIRQRYAADPAQRRLRLQRLGGDEALASYREGGIEALEAFCRRCVDGEPVATGLEAEPGTGSATTSSEVDGEDGNAGS